MSGLFCMLFGNNLQSYVLFNLVSVLDLTFETNRIPMMGFFFVILFLLLIFLSLKILFLKACLIEMKLNFIIIIIILLCFGSMVLELRHKFIFRL
jgi:hypothetical protein